jgi:RNA polymerase sigma-70 factor (ECF subfamily)
MLEAGLESVFERHAMMLQNTAKPPVVEPMDEREFQGLYELYNRQIYTFFANRGFGREESRDLVQETFLEAYHSRASFRREAPPQAWLFGIATNVWRMRVRGQSRLKRDARIVSLEAPAYGQASDPPRIAELAGAIAENCPLAKYLAVEQNRLLYEALQELPEKMRLVVVLFLRGYKYREISDILTVSLNTVRTQLFDAREKLRKRLADHFSELPPGGQKGSKT